MKLHHSHNTLYVALDLAPIGTVRPPDKRPISIPRSPRRATPLRRTHRSSRPRSSHRRRHSTSRDPSRRPSRASSVNLRSASPRRREVLPDNNDFYREAPTREPSYTSSSTVGTPTISSGIHHPTTSTTRMSTHRMTSHPPTSGNPGANGRTIHSPNLVPIHRVGLTIPRLPPNINATMTPPTSRPANLSLHFPPDRPRHNHTDPAQSNLVYPPVLSLLDIFPSISKMVPKRNGLVMSSML